MTELSTTRDQTVAGWRRLGAPQGRHGSRQGAVRELPPLSPSPGSARARSGGGVGAVDEHYKRVVPGALLAHMVPYLLENGGGREGEEDLLTA